MTFELITIPCLQDNYAYLMHDSAADVTLLIDAPESTPILNVLDARGWRLTHVLLTHHHWDHVDGLAGILDHHPAQVIGADADAHRLPPLDHAVSDGDIQYFGSSPCHILDVSGHTVGHIAFHFPDQNIIFTADSLMALGCGRLFEGTPDQMWASLSKLRALPDETIVCSGHEYTAGNARFAMTVDPENPDLIARVSDIATLRAADKPTVPSLLGLEKRTNPFLRPDCPRIRATLGMPNETDAAVFAEIRSRKDKF